MRTREAAAEALAGIGDAALLSAPRDEAVEQAYGFLRDISFDGIAVRVPARVDRAHATLPLLIAVEQDGLRDRTVPVVSNAAAVVFRPATGGSRAIPA